MYNDFNLEFRRNLNLFIDRLTVGPGYDTTPLARPGAKTGSRRFFGIESLKLV